MSKNEMKCLCDKLGVGLGEMGAKTRCSEITLQDIERAGCTSGNADDCLEFYRKALSGKKGGLAAQSRVNLFERIVEILQSKGP